MPNELDTPPQPKPETEPEQPCNNFLSENSLGELGEYYSHQCPICLGSRGFCENCKRDHHEYGWNSCKPATPKNPDTEPEFVEVIETHRDGKMISLKANGKEMLNQPTQPEGMEESRRALILEWLAKHINQYVGGTEDLSGVCLDGWFNLEELIAAAERRVVQDMLKFMVEAKIITHEVALHLAAKYLTTSEETNND